MKCQELQIWDWITDENGFPMQITNVGDDYAYATFEGNEGDPWEFDDKNEQPQPIEITYDLLKANGWKALIDEYAVTCDVCCFYESNSVLLEWDKSRKILTIWCDWIRGNGRISADIIIPCKYIHQIQQVLRIAGMTELANNFKI
jgi:hypothetical protein